MATGHGAASGRDDRLREVAFDEAFMLWQKNAVEIEGRDSRRTRAAAGAAPIT